MSMTNQTLSFLSHMQRGLARHRSANGTVAASVTLAAGPRSEEITQDLRVAGAEHVTSVSSGQVIRMVPSPDSVNFEPNFFPSIEFRLPDLPWMFSNVASGQNISPWMVLVVLEQASGAHVSDPTSDRPGVLTLPSSLSIARELPNLSESWAWAHVQCDSDLEGAKAADLYLSNPEMFRSRLICPRRLKPLTDYVACVVPATQGGVASGLGMELGETPQDPAWTGSETGLRLPVYHSWSFKTSQKGDFEDLVRRLSPIELEAGVVGLDLSNPGDPRLPEKKGPVVMFKGALVGTEAQTKPWDEDHKAIWHAAMNDILSTHRPGADLDKQDYNALKDDPVVAPPLWGSRKINVQTAPEPPDPAGSDDWFAQLNYHPALRAASGLGAESVRRNQEELMAEAWRQVAELRAVNRTLNQTLLAGEVTNALKTHKVDPLPAEDAVVLAGVAKARLGARFEAIKVDLNVDYAPQGVFTPTLARVGRVKGPIGKHTSLSDSTASATIAFFADEPEQAAAFADFTAPAQMANTDFIAQLSPPGLTPPQQSVVADYLQVDLVMRPLGGAASSTISATDLQIRPINRTVIRAELQGTTQMRRMAPVSQTKAAKPKRKTAQSQQTTTAKRKAATVVTLGKMSFDPIPVLKERLNAKLDVPGGLPRTPVLPRPILVTPEFDISGYTMLRAISPDAVMPGVKTVPMNSVGLAKVNAKFVESWMVGANAEMAREFLWREYPGRLDGTYFKRFWDHPDGSNDIGDIAGWQKRLGAHQEGRASDGTLVLLVKGELLERFPDLRIYASKARWDDRRFRLESRENGKPSDQRMPLFGGWLDRATAFFAFKLDLDEAKGTLELMGPDPGWFFVFEQPPEGVQFGLDVPARDPIKLSYWADLDWSHALDKPDGSGAQVHVSLSRGVGADTLPYDLDMFVETWGGSASAQARITLQRPARVLMHASGMLG